MEQRAKKFHRLFKVYKTGTYIMVEVDGVKKQRGYKIQT